MKIAILLLVHKNKEQLERLIGTLKHKDVDIFIHIDNKCDFGPSDLSVSDNVFFTEIRYDACLFEFSLVDAEFELIRAAKNHGSYKYFILVSGQCYPLKSIERIHTYLEKNYPKPFIDIITPTEENYVNKVFKHVNILKRFKLKTYEFLKRNFSFKMYRILRYIPGGFVYLISMIKEIFCKSPNARLTKLGYINCCGAQWWILPDTIIEIMQLEYENKPFCQAISDAFGCDETFFQTAIMKHKDKFGIELDEQGNYMEKRWFHIFDGGHPIILKCDHFDQLVNSDMFFARKFDTSIDDEILNMLDNNLRNN